MPEYIVEITRRPGGEQSAHVQALADVFNLSPDKAEQLLRRLPGVVTKPVPERLARTIAQRFREVGLEASVRPQPAPPFSPEPASSSAGYPSFDLDAPASTFSAPAAASVASPPPAPVHAPQDAPRYAPGAAADSTERPIQRGEPAPAVLVSERERPPRRARRRGSIRSKLLSIAIWPTLLAIAGALVVTWFVVRPALYAQLLDSARNPAIATAASLSSSLQGAGSESESLRLLDTILVARQTFPRDSISFIVATDTEGSPISGWFEEERGFDTTSRALEQAIRSQAVEAAARTGSASRAESTGSYQLATGERIEIVAQPLLGQDEAVFGTVVVGVTDRAVSAQVQRILLSILLLSLVPLALAIIFAVARSRSITRPIVQLTQRADEISRGDLDRSVDDVRSNDELEALAQALERMRVSMQEAMARLRRRRG